MAGAGRLVELNGDSFAHHFVQQFADMLPTSAIIDVVDLGQFFGHLGNSPGTVQQSPDIGGNIGHPEAGPTVGIQRDKIASDFVPQQVPTALIGDHKFHSLPPGGNITGVGVGNLAMRDNNISSAKHKRHSFEEYRLAAEAWLWLGLARFAVVTLPFRAIVRLIRQGGSRRGGIDGRQGEPVDAIVLAIDRASHRAPFRAKCFERGLAGHWMMYWRGIPTRFHYGIAQGGPDGLNAHVWISHHGRVVLGAETAANFAEVGAWPKIATPDGR